MASVEERLQRLEDQIAIYQTVCGYGYAVDGLNADALGEIYAEDGVYAVGDLAQADHLPGPMFSLAAAIAGGQLAAVAVVQSLIAR